MTSTRRTTRLLTTKGINTQIRESYTGSLFFLARNTIPIMRPTTERNCNERKDESLEHEGKRAHRWRFCQAQRPVPHHCDGRHGVGWQCHPSDGQFDQEDPEVADFNRRNHYEVTQFLNPTRV